MNKRGEKFFLIKGKKGQELSTSTIILLVLGVIILVILIIGFSTGWSFFKNLISPTNVDNVIQDCNTACATDQKFSFCSAERSFRVNEEKVDIKTSCAVLANSPQFVKYGIQKCSSIICDLPCASIVINSKAGVVSASGTGGKYDVSALANDLEEGQICIIN
jgi:hypothetical protein